MGLSHDPISRLPRGSDDEVCPEQSPYKTCSGGVEPGDCGTQDGAAPAASAKQQTRSAERSGGAGA